jgi:hypothetical protein
MDGGKRKMEREGGGGNRMCLLGVMYNLNSNQKQKQRSRNIKVVGEYVNHVQGAIVNSCDWYRFHSWKGDTMPDLLSALPSRSRLANAV